MSACEPWRCLEPQLKPPLTTHPVLLVALRCRLNEKDKYIKGLLTEFSTSQAEGAWLNELCEHFYKTFSRSKDEEWPSGRFKQEDIKLREMLTRSYVDGEHLRKVAKATFPTLPELSGPRPEWGCDAHSRFGDFNWSPPEKSMALVVDVSHSMKFVASSGNERTHPITVQCPAGVKSGQPFRAQAPDENGEMKTYTLNCPEGQNGPCELRVRLLRSRQTLRTSLRRGTHLR